MGLFVLAPLTLKASDAVVLPEDVFPVLEGVLRDAVVGSPEAIAERIRVEEAGAEAEARAAGGRPFVTGAFRYVGRVEERRDLDGTRWGDQPHGLVSLRQPVFHWGAISANREIGEIRLGMAEEEREEALRLLALEVRRRFLDLAVGARMIELGERNLELAELRLENGVALSERGEISAEAVEELRLAREEAGFRLERMRRERELAVEEFFRVAGVEARSEFPFPVGVPDFAVRGEGELLALNDSLPQLEIARKRIAESERQYEIEVARDRPKLNLIVGVSQDQVPVFDRSDIDRTIFYAGAEVTWTIFDGFESRARRDAALARRRLEKRNLARLTEEAAARVSRFREEVEWAGNALRLSERRRELSRRNFDLIATQAERGEASEADVAAGRVAFAERELALTEARANYLMASARYWSAAGADRILTANGHDGAKAEMTKQ